MKTTAIYPTALLITLFILAGCGNPSSSNSQGSTSEDTSAEVSSATVQETPMNCLIVVLDAFHAGNSSLYGFPEPTTPNIEKWAKKGVVFDDAVSQFISTSTSSWSYLNGRYPYHSKGISRIRKQDVPIAELFKEAGYRTSGYSDNPFINERMGTDKGFDSFQYHAFKNDPNESGILKKRNDNSQLLFDEASQWVQNGSTEPWFAYVHTLRPHNPYPAEEPFLSQFVDTANVPKGEDAQEFFYTLETAADIKYYLEGWTPGFEEKVELMHRLYLGNIAQIDSMLDDLLQELDDAGQLENTMVVIMSDHGEAFGEHKTKGHALLAPHREVIHVPFVLIPPASLDFKPGRISTAIELTDMLPTLTDIFGLDDTTRRDGQSLVPLMRGEEGYSKSVIFAQSPYQLSVKRGNHKLIYKVHDWTRDSVSGESYTSPMPSMMYNLSDDPGEQVNLFPDNRIDEQLLEIGGLYMSAQELNEPVKLQDLTEEELEVMESLGYVN